MKVADEHFVLSPSFDPPARRDYSSTEFRTNIVNERTAGKKQASLTLVAAELFPRINNSLRITGSQVLVKVELRESDRNRTTVQSAQSTCIDLRQY